MCLRNSKQCWEYIMDPFNIIDQVTMVTSFAAWMLRWAALLQPDEQKWMTSARYLFSFDFMLYMFRFLEFFYLSKFLGPILVFIRHMVKTFLHFLLILMIFMIAYAIASESILYPETELTPVNVYNIFRKGIWAMMGEYWLDEISGDDCGGNSNVYLNNLTNQRCPTTDGRFTVPVLLALYAVFVQILMFNLLIALFTNAITENESKRDQIWRYQRLQLTMQYSETRILLPPFTPLFFWLDSRVGNPFISTISEDYIAVKHFEHTSAQKIIKKIIDYSLDKDLLDEEKKVKINTIDTTMKEILQLLKKERRGSVTSEATQTNERPDIIVQKETQDTEIKETQDTETEETRDTEIEESQDTEIEETRDTEIKESQDTEIEETQDTEIEESQDTEIEETQDTEIEETRDTEIEESQDTEIEETQDTEIEESQDTEIEETQDTEIEETQDTEIEETRDTEIEESQDTEIEETQDTEIEETRDTEIEDTQDTEIEETQDTEIEETQDTEIEETQDTESDSENKHIKHKR
ncbi:hypothetical protein Btru_038746 [Bulinus truncatus]|nr:hypothetical protein Btru_038746 [Bulinus truncatus]